MNELQKLEQQEKERQRKYFESLQNTSPNDSDSPWKRVVFILSLVGLLVFVLFKVYQPEDIPTVGDNYINQSPLENTSKISMGEFVNKAFENMWNDTTLYKHNFVELFRTSDGVQVKISGTLEYVVIDVENFKNNIKPLNIQLYQDILKKEIYMAMSNVIKYTPVENLVNKLSNFNKLVLYQLNNNSIDYDSKVNTIVQSENMSKLKSMSIYSKDILTNVKITDDTIVEKLTKQLGK